jgi:indoleamine 2,3-dioxygenase
LYNSDNKIRLAVVDNNHREGLMEQTCWQIHADRGFLIAPDPAETLPDLSADLAQAMHVAAQTQTLLKGHTLRSALDELPVADTSGVREWHAVERLMQAYSYLASSYVYATDEPPASRIPAGVAVPFVALAKRVQRPPILSYSGYVLNNWRRIDPAGDIALGNIETIQHFRGGRDEDWFVLVHVDIEARAAGALQGIQAGVRAAQIGDLEGLEEALGLVAASVEQMIISFRRMPEQCDSDVYYWQVRPYIFSFTNVIYDGVAEFGGQPQSFRGQTGAQSSIVPALVAALGLQHEQSGLTQHLEIMKNYMPLLHREFIAQIGASRIRQMVIEAGQPALSEIYNLCLRRVLEFRRLHFHYATTYIAQKVADPVGTGGTIFMDWLAQLADETEAQLVPEHAKG